MIKINELLKLGDVFGDLTVVDLSPVIIDRRQQIRVKCKCGSEFYVRPDRLIERNRSCFQCAGIKRKGKRTVFAGDLCSKIVNDIKHNAKVRNISFEVDIQFLWILYQNQEGKCALTGVPINLKLESFNGYRSRAEVTASLDRIDNSKGYTKDNVQWVHKWVNIMKGALNNKSFIYVCNKVAENFNFEYDNIEPSLMDGWMPRMFARRQDRKEGATTSSVSSQNNNQNQERPTSQCDEDIV